MTLKTYQIGDVTVVQVPGPHLDSSVVEEFKAGMSNILQNSNKIVVDMEALEFVDSSGLGALLGCLRRLNADSGDLKLCRLRKPVRTMFEMVRMHRVFEIYGTPEEAAETFRAAGPRSGQ